ncbi:ABC transporter ATP-binding protein [Psychromonas sp. MB-3u-54]|uniref:ABC transporter ATP-binding protein n=1 Tax=Psychromonas sp. MB-3u-54 TaxID=2058319 RepID=UPI0026CDC289
MSASMRALSAKIPALQIDISAGYLRYTGSKTATLQGLNMSFPAGQWTCILGRSGCGKTSLLRYLAGLLDQKTSWSGELKTTPPQFNLKNNIAYMAQQDLLMPWLSVLDNVTLSAKFGNTITAVQKQAALALLEKVGLLDSADCLPQKLSGGMRQRVALARTLMQNKPVILMDEPFSAVDAVTRYRLQDLAWELLKDKTVVLITHDPQEAIRLADQIYIMQGKPSSAESLKVPASLTPRQFDPECAQLQQSIMAFLEQDDA